ncbi:MAG: M48 family metallopeptidase [Gemmatimonadota bacterium]
MWRLDADAMNALRSLGPLTAAAHAVSERVGRPWMEASTNGLRLSERQLPDIFAAAIRAARILALPYLPEIYVSGDQMWEAVTLGTDTSSFIVLGSVLTNFSGDDLLFLLGREMGHCRAGHALWKTVLQFVSGRSHAKRSIMGEGVLRLLNPAKLVESAIDAPLMAWARHAEITADFAGLLVTGQESVARRVLQTWTFRSFPLMKRLDMEAWSDQEQASDETMVQVAEWTMSSTPYLAGRLKLMREYARSEELHAWRAIVDHWTTQENSKKATAAAEAPHIHYGDTRTEATVRLVCVSCRQPMQVPRAALAGTQTVNVRCPNSACRSLLAVRPRGSPSSPEREIRSTA